MSCASDDESKCPGIASNEPPYEPTILAIAPATVKPGYEGPLIVHGRGFDARQAVTVRPATDLLFEVAEIHPNYLVAHLTVMENATSGARDFIILDPLMGALVVPCTLAVLTIAPMPFIAQEWTKLDEFVHNLKTGVVKTVYVDSTGDGVGDTKVSSLDRNRDGQWDLVTTQTNTDSKKSYQTIEYSDGQIVELRINEWQLAGWKSTMYLYGRDECGRVDWTYTDVQLPDGSYERVTYYYYYNFDGSTTTMTITETGSMAPGADVPSITSSTTTQGP